MCIYIYRERERDRERERERRFAWPLRKDDTHEPRSVNSLRSGHIGARPCCHTPGLHYKIQDSRLFGPSPWKVLALIV